MRLPPLRAKREKQSSSRPLLQPEITLTAQYFLQRARMPWPTNRPSLPLNAFPPVTLLPQVHRRVKEQRHKLILADPLETGPPLSSERHDMASTARVMGTACVAARWEPFVLPEHVLNTMAESRAPSTRRLYALKWYIFSAWCQDQDLDPVTSDVSVVLSFLQEMLEK